MAVARILRAFSSHGRLERFLVRLDAAGDLVGQLLLEPLQQQLLGLLAGQAADLVQLFASARSTRVSASSTCLSRASLRSGSFFSLCCRSRSFFCWAWWRLLEGVFLFSRRRSCSRCSLRACSASRLNSSRFLNSSSLACSSASLRMLSAVRSAWMTNSRALDSALIEIGAIAAANEPPGGAGAAAQAQKRGQENPDHAFHNGHGGHSYSDPACFVGSHRQRKDGIVTFSRRSVNNRNRYRPGRARASRPGGVKERMPGAKDGGVEVEHRSAHAPAPAPAHGLCESQYRVWSPDTRGWQADPPAPEPPSGTKRASWETRGCSVWCETSVGWDIHGRAGKCLCCPEAADLFRLTVLTYMNLFNRPAPCKPRTD